MKTLKYFIILAALAVSVNANAQVELFPKLCDAGASYSAYFPDVDSLAASNIYYSGYKDWSVIDGQSTISITYAYTTVGNTSDTLFCILQGVRDVGNMTTGLVYDMDTLILVGASTRTVRNAGAVTLSSSAPMFRLQVKESTGGAAGNANRNNGTLEISVYATTLDTWYDKIGLTRSGY